jgi:hypothetical protein
MESSKSKTENIEQEIYKVVPPSPKGIVTANQCCQFMFLFCLYFLNSLFGLQLAANSKIKTSNNQIKPQH